MYTKYSRKVVYRTWTIKKCFSQEPLHIFTKPIVFLIYVQKSANRTRVMRLENVVNGLFNVNVTGLNEGVVY